MPAANAATATLWDQFPEGAARELVRAGFEEFATRGFAATTTRDIARAAGLSPAGLYVHYPSKAALLLVLSRAGHEAAAAVLFDALAVDLPVVERLAQAIGRFAAWHAEHHRIARVVQLELTSLDEDGLATVAALRRRIQGAVADEIRAAVAAGDTSVPDVAGTARACMSLCIDVCRWYDPAGTQTPDDIAGLYTELVRRWLVGGR